MQIPLQRSKIRDRRIYLVCESALVGEQQHWKDERRAVVKQVTAKQRPDSSGVRGCFSEVNRLEGNFPRRAVQRTVRQTQESGDAPRLGQWKRLEQPGGLDDEIINAL